MRRRTTTKQLYNALSNNLLTVERAESHNKTSHQTDEISVDTFKDSLEFLCETIFADAVGWHYEYDIKANQYIIEVGRMNGDADFIFIAHLCACDGVSREDVDIALKVIEEE